MARKGKSKKKQGVKSQAQPKVTVTVKAPQKKSAKKSKKRTPRQASGRRGFIPLAGTVERPKVLWKSLTPTLGGKFRLQGVDFVTNVNTSSTWKNVLTQFVSPTNKTLFSKLPYYAAQWRRYRFHRVAFCYYGETAATTAGEVAHYMESDPAAPVFQVEADVLNFENSVAGPAWGYRSEIHLPPDKDWKYVTVDGKDAADIRMQNSGYYALFTKAGPTSAVFCGQVMVMYDVEFMDHKPPDVSTVSALTVATQDIPVGHTGTIQTAVGDFLDELWNWGWETDTKTNVNTTTPLIEEVGDNDWSDALLSGGTEYLLEWWFDIGAEGTTLKKPYRRPKSSLKERVMLARPSRSHSFTWRDGAVNIETSPNTVSDLQTAVYLVDAYDGTNLNPVGSSTNRLLLTDYLTSGAIVDANVTTFTVPSGRTAKCVYDVFASTGSGSDTTRAIYEMALDLGVYDPTANAIPPPVPEMDELKVAFETLRQQFDFLSKAVPSPFTRTTSLVDNGGKSDEKKVYDKCFYCGEDPPDHPGRDCPLKPKEVRKKPARHKRVDDDDVLSVSSEDGDSKRK